MQYYHPFKKTVKSKNGKTKRVFYYWYFDENGTQKQKVIKGCTTAYEANIYCSKLPPPEGKSPFIKDIAKDMYLPGSEHVIQREQLGYSVNPQTLKSKRAILNTLLQDFGNMDLADVTVQNVFAYLSKKDRAPSWKNLFISVLEEIYRYAGFCGLSLQIPNFLKFKINAKKADPLTNEEILLLLNRKNFISEKRFMLFLLMTSAGLRVSEARAFQARQFLPDLQMILVDGSISLDNKMRNPYNKCGNKEKPKWRLVLIPKETVDAIGNYIAKNNLSGDDYLFTTSSGKTIQINSIRSTLFYALRRAGIDIGERKITLHSLRYTFVTHTREYFDADVVRQMVGHTDIKTTDYYTVRRLQDEQKKLSALISDANKFFQI